MVRAITVLASLAFVTSAMAATALPTPQQLAAAKYQGARTCRPCHMNPQQGRMFAIWEASKHSKAFETLGTPAAKQVGQRLGVANPQTDAKCLKCHVTAASLPAARKTPRLVNTEGVGCESCHGAGEFYKARNTMCGVVAGQIQAAKVGLTIPDERVCRTCHNQESPTFQGFNYQQALQKIAHPLPAERRQRIQREGCARPGAAGGQD